MSDGAKKFIKRIVPAIFKEDGDHPKPLYSGHVDLKIPSYDDRIGLVESLGANALETDDNPEALQPSQVETRRRNIAMSRALARELPRFIDSVDITRKADEYHITTWDEVLHEGDLQDAVSELSMMLMGKFSVGNGSAPS